MKFNYGLNQLSMPVYDKKLWLSDSFFEPPTIRSVASLVCDIAGSATGQSWWLGILDDALFASLDIVVEDKDVGEVATEFGKAALTNTISAGLGAASNGLSALAGNISNTAAKVATQAAISASSAYISQVSNSYINALSYSAENGWSMDWDNANNSWFSNDTLAATLGAGLSTGISTGLNEFNLGVNNSKVLGFNSNQIDSIKNLNNLAGGLASSAVSFAFTGNATFNILNLSDFGSRINGGLLELTVGKDGVSSKIGNGGTNISYSTIKSSISGASSLHKNSQINKTGYDKTTLDALRSQYGFGDKTAKKQLEEIIKGETVLKFDAAGSEVAQSVTENGQKIIHINSSQNEGFIDLGLTLQHEAHRDGIISDEQSQYIETVNAVAGHTKMALAMTNDKLYTKDMLNHISSDTNLQNDINAYMYAAYTGNTGLFAGYVGASYDSSADYWRVLSNGNIVFDDKKDLYDENGLLLKHYEGSGGYTDSLATMLGISYEEAKTLMQRAKYYSYEDGSFYDKDSNSAYLNEDMQINTSDKFKATYDFQVNYADNVWEDFGGSMEVALSSFKTNYELGNGLISNETLQGLDLVSGFNQYAKQYDKYMIAYYNEKLNMQYDSNDSRAAIKEIDKIITTGDFNDNNTVYNALGAGGILNPIPYELTKLTVKSMYLDENGEFNGSHGWGNPRGFAIDLGTYKVEGYSVYSNIDAYLYSNSVNSNNPLNLNTGNEVRLFGNNNTSIYGHLQSNSFAMMMLDNLSNSATQNDLWRSYIPAGTQIGNVGNTGNSSGPHLHWEYRLGYQYWNNRSK